MNTEQLILTIATKGFRGVEMQIRKENAESFPVKLVNPLRVMELVGMLKDYLRNIVPIMHAMNYYRHYGENIEEILDDEEKIRDLQEELYYHISGNFAFFLETKHNTDAGIVYADNNEAAKIIEEEYNKVHPEHKISFDSEMSDCCFSTKDREEAHKFMHWMNDTYFKPWVDANLDGWGDFVAIYKEATPHQQAMFNHYLFQ